MLQFQKDESQNSDYKNEHNVRVYCKGSIVDKKITISIKNSVHNLKINLSDEKDLFFLYSLNITHEDYLQLKNEQGLLINFSEFPDQIINLLKQCFTGKMFLQLLSTKPQVCNLEFVERSDFKNLVHLRLDFVACENDEIMENICHKMNSYKELINKLEKNNEYLTKEVSVLNGLNSELKQIKANSEDTLKQEYSEMVRKKEQEYMIRNSQLESELNKNKNEIKDLNARINELNFSQKNLKKQIVDCKESMNNMADEVNKLQIENENLKFKNIKLDEDYHKKEKDLNMAHKEIAALQQSLANKNDLTSILKETLTKADNENETLRNKLVTITDEYSKLQSAIQNMSTDLMKANQIIAQNTLKNDVLKKKLNVVSKVSITIEKEKENLQKELEEKTCAIDNLKKELQNENLHLKELQKEHDRLWKMISSKDENIKELKKIIESQYNRLKSETVKTDDNKKEKNYSPMDTHVPFSEWKPLPEVSVSSESFRESDIRHKLESLKTVPIEKPKLGQAIKNSTTKIADGISPNVPILKLNTVSNRQKTTPKSSSYFTKKAYLREEPKKSD